jgi:hypothetical protein
VRAFQDVFNVSYVDPVRRDILNKVKNRSLAWLGEHGLQVVVSRELNDLSEFWVKYRGGKNLLEMPYFDRHYWPGASRRDTLLLFLEKDGQLVGSCGFRALELFDRARMRPLTLGEAIRERHFFYQHPELGPQDETAECYGKDTRSIHDCFVCVAGSVWLRPDLQGLDHFKAFVRVARLATFTMPEFSWSYAATMYVNRNRDIALDHYGMSSFNPVGIRFRGQDWWLVTADRQDIIEITLAAADRPFSDPLTF